MAQAFITIYRDHYRWNSVARLLPIHPFEFENIVTNDDWITNEDKQDIPEEQTEDVNCKKRINRRYWTNYQIDYCKIGRKEDKGKIEDEEDSDYNETLVRCRELYESDFRKVLPPIVTHRRVLGFMKASRCKTPFTTYQKMIGKPAYEVWNKNLKKK